MWNFLAPPAYKQELPAEKIDSTYKSYRWQVFLGIFIGYAGFYIVRKNFSMAIPELGQFGFEKGELSIVLSMNAVAYALSKFLMGSVSDRSNARVFLPLGLVLAAVSMMFMIVPVQFFGPEQKSLAIIVMAVLNFLILPALLPALVMTYVSTSYIFVSPLMCGMRNRVAAYALGGLVHRCADR